MDGSGWTGEALQKNYESISALLSPKSPARSLLLLKLTPMNRGGVDHDGGKADGGDMPESLLASGGPLVSWIFGGSETSKPPIAVVAPWPRTIERGKELAFDASLSYDPDKEKVEVEWEIVEAPLGAEARLSETNTAKTSITPDRDGPWLLRCTVRDPKLAGWPVLVRFAVTRPKEAGTSDDIPMPTVDIDTRERRLTRALYLDLVGRTPTEEELGLIASLSHEKRVDKLLASREAWEHWFDEEAFFFLLIDRFRPVSDRLANVAERMRDDHTTFRDAHMEFALSAEFNSRNPGNDTYVSVVLEQFLGIEVQKEHKLLNAAKKMYDGGVDRIFKQKGNSQSDVVRITLEQPDYVEMFVTRMETRYLDQPLAKEEHDIAVARLRLDPKELRALLREWLTSDIYTSEDRAPKAKDDHQFIRSLFVDLLGRPPALQEFRNMRNALQALTDPAPLRGVLAKVMLDSASVLPPRQGKGVDTKTTITELFHRFLGRDPSGKELGAFVNAFEYDKATWKTAALALLTSPHYQYY